MKSRNDCCGTKNFSSRKVKGKERNDKTELACHTAMVQSRCEELNKARVPQG